MSSLSPPASSSPSSSSSSTSNSPSPATTTQESSSSTQSAVQQESSQQSSTNTRHRHLTTTPSPPRKRLRPDANCAVGIMIVNNADDPLNNSSAQQQQQDGGNVSAAAEGAAAQPSAGDAVGGGAQHPQQGGSSTGGGGHGGRRSRNRVKGRKNHQNNQGGLQGGGGGRNKHNRSHHNLNKSKDSLNNSGTSEITDEITSENKEIPDGLALKEQQRKQMAIKEGQQQPKAAAPGASSNSPGSVDAFLASSVPKRKGLTRMDQEIVRLIGQHLTNIGLKTSAKVLMHEAGCKLDQPSAGNFRKYVMNGEWVKAIKALEDLKDHLKKSEHLSEMRYLLLEQKFFEYLAQKKKIEALRVLQTELTPMTHCQVRTHELSSYLMLSKHEDILKAMAMTRPSPFTGNGGAGAKPSVETTAPSPIASTSMFMPPPPNMMAMGGAAAAAALAAPMMPFGLYSNASSRQIVSPGLISANRRGPTPPMAIPSTSSMATAATASSSSSTAAPGCSLTYRAVRESSRQALMDRLQAFLPPSVMLPPRRLMSLLNQASQYQIDKCLFHNREPLTGLFPPPTTSNGSRSNNGGCSSSCQPQNGNSYLPMYSDGGASASADGDMYFSDEEFDYDGDFDLDDIGGAGGLEAEIDDDEDGFLDNRAGGGASVGGCSLVTDHQCSRREFPTETIQVLRDHAEEVWFCKWSPNGRRLATSSKDVIVAVWEYDPDSMNLTKSKELERRGPPGGGLGDGGSSACFFAWSPDSMRLAICDNDDSNEDVIIWNAESGETEARIGEIVPPPGNNGNNHQTRPEPFSAVAWSRDGSKLVCGGKRGVIHICDLNGVILETQEGVRAISLYFMNDGFRVLASDTHKRIRCYIFGDANSIVGADASGNHPSSLVLQESHDILSFTVDESERYALLNVKTQGLHMWDLRYKCLLRRFVGVSSEYYTIHSCFGGRGQAFLASGSEDNSVFVYNSRKEDPILRLTGHTRTVNAVSWNPVYRHVIASASDDNTVRLWGPGEDYRNARRRRKAQRAARRRAKEQQRQQLAASTNNLPARRSTRSSTNGVSNNNNYSRNGDLFEADEDGEGGGGGQNGNVFG